MELDNKNYVEIEEKEFLELENESDNEIIELRLWKRHKCCRETKYFKCVLSESHE